MKQKVFQVYHEYTETYCHPNPANWTKKEHVLITTFDPEKAKAAQEEYNAKKDRWAESAYIRYFDISMWYNSISHQTAISSPFKGYGQGGSTEPLMGMLFNMVAQLMAFCIRGA